MDLSEEDRQMIINFGALGYTDPQLMADLLAWSVTDLKREQRKKKSEFSRLYRKGTMLIEYRIDLALARRAEQGDTKAIEILTKRKDQRLFNL